MQISSVLRATSPTLSSGVVAVAAVTADVVAAAKEAADKARDDKLKKRIAELIAAKQKVAETQTALAAAVALVGTFDKNSTDSIVMAQLSAAVLAQAVAQKQHDDAVTAWSVLVKATREAAAAARAKLMQSCSGKDSWYDLSWDQWTILGMLVVLVSYSCTVHYTRNQRQANKKRYMASK